MSDPIREAFDEGRELGTREEALRWKKLVPDWIRHNPDSLDAAWSDAEAVLPEGWEIDALYRVVSRTSLDREWEVVVHEADWQGDEDSHSQRGPTPAAALRALASKLRERAG